MLSNLQSTGSSPTISRASSISSLSISSPNPNNRKSSTKRKRSSSRPHILIRETIIEQVITTETVEVISRSQNSARERQTHSESSVLESAAPTRRDLFSENETCLRHHDFVASALPFQDENSRPESIFNDSLTSEASIFVNSITARQSEALNDLFSTSKYDLVETPGPDSRDRILHHRNRNEISAESSDEEIEKQHVIHSMSAYTPSPIESLLQPEDGIKETNFPFEETDNSKKDDDKNEIMQNNGSVPISEEDDIAKKDAAIQAMAMEMKDSNKTSFCGQCIWMLLTIVVLLLLAGIVMSALFETSNDLTSLPPFLQTIYADYYQPMKLRIL